MIPQVKGIHLEPTNICTLKCPGCARTRFIDQWPKHWKNHSLDRSALMQFLDLDLENVQISMCGNYGDPIYHPDLAGMVRDLKARGAIISIVTNGSHRKRSWWQDLVNELSANDCVTFSIDGIPENFTQYRINGDWETVQGAIEICVTAPCQTKWKYIPFSFNEHNIEQARQLATDLGIDLFQIVNSDRFDEVTMHFKPTENQIGSRWHAQQTWKQSHTINKLIPKCHDGQAHYISADGHYMPCCYVGDHRFYYKTEFGKNKKHYAILDNTLSKILEKSTVSVFYDHLTEQSACQFNCGE
jgi:MoaA/NifB/PqqE/SkfB family radical SAM enzyme